MEKNTCLHLCNLLFTTSQRNDKVHRSVVVYNNKHAVTYCHGTTHSKFTEKQQLTLYSVHDNDLDIPVEVYFINKQADYVVFRTTGQDFPYYPSNNDDIYSGMSYHLLGINEKRELVWDQGIISFYKYGFYFGTTQGQKGNSGTAVFNSKGMFVGIVLGMKTFAFSNSKHELTEVANFDPDVKILAGDVFFQVLGRNALLQVQSDNDPSYHQE